MKQLIRIKYARHHFHEIGWWKKPWVISFRQSLICLAIFNSFPIKKKRNEIPIAPKHTQFAVSCILHTHTHIQSPKYSHPIQTNYPSEHPLFNRSWKATHVHIIFGSFETNSIPSNGHIACICMYKFLCICVYVYVCACLYEQMYG